MPQFSIALDARFAARLASGLLPVIPFLAAVCLLLLAPAAGAQVPQPLVQQSASMDPPGRVARLNLAEGPVSFASGDVQGNPQGDSGWMAAVLNRPMTSGDRLWTGPRARSELHIGSTAVRLGEQTSLDLLTLDDNSTQLRVAQGTVKLRVRALFDGQRIEVNTPNLAFMIEAPGDYRVDAVPASNISAGSTRVVVQQGAGTIYGDGGALIAIAEGQQANFTGTQLTPAGHAPEVQDSFDAWALQRDRLEDQSVSARYIPREVVGYQQLDSYGDWSQDPTYGAVWLPRSVPSNWAPYRAGQWSWVAPWGWTWVDDAPWGFAPFHYGRWAQIGPRWGWVPGRLAPRPVYAPALVGFVGGANWNVSLGQRAAQPGLGWFPLAPGEAWRPAYRVSPRYINQVNHNYAVNDINNNYRYRHQHSAVSAMSAEDFARGQPVRANQQGLSPADLGRAQVLSESRGALPQRVIGLMNLPRQVNPAALPPAGVGVRPVVGIQPLPNRREDLRDPGRGVGQGQRDGSRDGPRDAFQGGRPGGLPPGAQPDRGAFDAGQRAREDQQRQLQDRQQGQQREQERQQRELARQQQDRAAQRQQDESLMQRSVREQAQRNGSLPAAAPLPQARPDFERSNRADPVQRSQPVPNQESLGQRAMQEQVMRQAREQQTQQIQQQQRQQQDQARQQQQAAQMQQQAQQQAQQRAQQQQQQQQQQQPRQQAEPNHNPGRERQLQPQPDGAGGRQVRPEELFNRRRD
jgi:hypothetical protein